METSEKTIIDPEYAKVVEEEEDSILNNKLDDGHGKHDNHEGTSTYTTASFQIANTIMGAGILSLPMVMQYLGLILGSLFIMVVAICTIYSVNMLLNCKDLTGKSGYSMFAKICYGRPGSLAVKIVIIINNFGLCCAYFRIFGDVSVNLATAFISEDSFFVTNWHNFFYIMIIFFIMFTLIYRESIESLKGASFLGVLGISMFFICLIILYIYKFSNNLIDEKYSFNSDFLWPKGNVMDIIASLPTVFLAFTFQFNAFPVYYSLKERNNKEMLKGSVFGVGFCLIIYIITGIVGYLMYGPLCTKSILPILKTDMAAFKDSDKFIVTVLCIINVAFLISSTMSIPLMFFTLKKNFINSIIFCNKKKISSEEDSEVNSLHTVDQSLKFQQKERLNPSQLSNSSIGESLRLIIITSLYILICFVTIVIPDLDIIFSIVGSTAANAISFIMPNLFLIKLSKSLLCDSKNLVSKCLLIFGIIILIICLIGEIIRTVNRLKS